MTGLFFFHIQKAPLFVVQVHLHFIFSGKSLRITIGSEPVTLIMLPFFFVKIENERFHFHLFQSYYSF